MIAAYDSTLTTFFSTSSLRKHRWPTFNSNKGTMDDFPSQRCPANMGGGGYVYLVHRQPKARGRNRLVGSLLYLEPLPADLRMTMASSNWESFVLSSLRFRWESASSASHLCRSPLVTFSSIQRTNSWLIL